MTPAPAPPTGARLAAIVLTRNEEKHLPDCLASLAWAPELMVFDSFSTDRTVALAQALRCISKEGSGGVGFTSGEVVLDAAKEFGASAIVLTSKSGAVSRFLVGSNWLMKEFK